MALHHGGNALGADGGSALVGFLQSGAGAQARSVESKLRDTPSPCDFDITEDNDSTTGFQAWLDACQAEGIAPHSSRRLTVPISDTIEMGVPLVTTDYTGMFLSNILLLYSGTRDRPAFKVDATSGGSTVLNGGPELWLPRVEASGALQWPGALGGDDCGILLEKIFHARIYVPWARGFTKGYEFRNCSYNDVSIGHLTDNKYAEVISTKGPYVAFEFSNENTFRSGKRGCTSASDSLGDAYGTVLIWDETSSYAGHNNNYWDHPCYELGLPVGATYRVPIWAKGVGAFNKWSRCRVEFCKGPTAIFDGGGTHRAHRNIVDVMYNFNVAQNNALLQVNDAAGNLYTGLGAEDMRWTSPDLKTLLSSYGGANAAYIRGPVFAMETAGSAALRNTATATRVITNTKALQLNGAAVCVAVDTSKIKTFRARLAALSGFAGRPFVIAWDSAGTRLTGDATDATWGDEPYVKFAGEAATASSSYGNIYTVGADGRQELFFTVRGEVASIWVGWASGTNALAAQRLEITGYSEPEDASNADAQVGMRVFVPLDDDGSLRLATAKPDTAGTHGYYAKGQKAYSASVAAAATDGWPCSTAGWLAPAWVLSTAYSVPGHVVTNDSGKMYELVTAGTSALSGGPTGTGSAITDGTCVWNYIGVKAVFVTSAVTT